MQRFLFSMNRLRMIMRSRVHILWFLFCIIPFLNGCAFWALSGGGPMSKEEAYRIVGRAPSQMTESQKEVAMELYNRARNELGISEKKDRVSMTAKWFVNVMFKLGINVRVESVAVEKPAKLENSLYTCDRLLSPGYPLIWPWWSEWFTIYNLGNGEEQQQMMKHGLSFLTILGGYARIVSPEIKKKGFPIVPSSYGDRYNVKTAYHLLLGICAFGRVNHRRYMQFLWIPIPLGAADD